MQSTDAPHFATKQQLAERYGVHPKQIQKLVDEGTLPCLRLGERIYRFNIQETDEALHHGGERD